MATPRTRTTRTTRTTRPSKSAKSAEPTPTPEPTQAEEPTPTPEPDPTPKAKVGTTVYRDGKDFLPALSAATTAAKGNKDLLSSLQLIRHLAWKTPGGSVGWSKGTTPTVIEFANDIAVPAGTAIPEALDAALSHASKAATDKPQQESVAVLAKVIKNHEA